MATPAEVTEFNRTVSKLIREAGTADAVELNRILRELAAVQSDMRKVFADGGTLADTVAKIERRINTFEGVLVDLLDEATPKAAARGVAVIDDGLAVVNFAFDVDASDVTEGPVRTMRAVARQQSADLYSKFIYQVTRMTGPNCAQGDRVIRSWLDRVRWSRCSHDRRCRRRAR
jgi:hypothetical protein